MSGSLQPYEVQCTRPPCPLLCLGACSNSRLLSRWCRPSISSSVAPFFPALNLSQHQCLFQWVDSLHQVAKLLEFQHHSRFMLIIHTQKKENRKRDERWEGEKKEGREGERKKRRKKRKHPPCDKLVPGLRALLLFPLFFSSLPNLLSYF